MKKWNVVCFGEMSDLSDEHAADFAAVVKQYTDTTARSERYYTQNGLSGMIVTYGVTARDWGQAMHAVANSWQVWAGEVPIALPLLSVRLSYAPAVVDHDQ